MRTRRVVRIWNFYLVLLLSGAMWTDPLAQPIENLFQTIELSVVKVECIDRGNVATGFVWREVNTVVSALHVVDGCSDIQIYYPAQRVRRGSSVQRVLKEGDLVLLEVENAPDVPVLQHSSRIPQLDEQIHSLGFMFNATAINSFTFNIRYGGRRLRDNISENVVRRLVRNGYPSPDLEVLKLSAESLLPGLSGAPIFDRQGRVVAVGNGGLEEGAINVSWGIPANYLNALLMSTDTSLPGGHGIRELFAAELQMNIGDTVSIGDIELIRVRTRTFQQLASSADDQLGLQQLSSNFSYFDPESFRYDIYQDIKSGATVVMPEGAILEQQSSGFLKVLLPPENGLEIQSRFPMILQIRNFSSYTEALAQTQSFEEHIVEEYSDVVWHMDPQWSYPTPQQRFDGLMVRRKAAVGWLPQYFPWIPDKYMFETLAIRGQVFVGLAAINTENNSDALNLETSCMQGIELPECPTLLQYRRAWAQIVLGIQLTSFSL